MRTRETKALYLSDSLGTPIHPRGIFNYSVSAIEILKSLGVEITLVVEGAAEYRHGNRADHQAIIDEVGSIGSVMQLAEVYRYFGERRFDFSFEYDRPAARLIARWSPELLKIVHRIREFFVRPSDHLLLNDAEHLNSIPAEARHLLLVDRIRVVDRFYSRSMLRAVNGTGRMSLDASGYDVVIVDTPHNVRLTGIKRDRVMAVVHDIIPLQDTHMPEDWRRLFERKLEATLELAGTLVFVSESTRDAFRSLFPQHDEVPNIIVYPAIRADLLSDAHRRRSPGSAYMQDLILRQRATSLEEGAKELPDGLPLALAMGVVEEDDVRAFLNEDTSWNPALPYFATVVSDEPRKNIKIFTAAAAALRNTANFVIMGQVDPNRYTDGAPNHYSNLHFTGYVSDEEKRELIGNSTGLVFASFSEGFGIPVIEGAVFGRPVICADIPVFREITGGLAHYIDPHEPEDLVRAVHTILAAEPAAEAATEPLREFCVARYNQAAMATRLGAAIASIEA